jgi:hypothetical protein
MCDVRLQQIIHVQCRLADGVVNHGEYSMEDYRILIGWM